MEFRQRNPLAPSEESFAFGPFLLVPARKVLLEAGKPVLLGSRALEILTVLVYRAGEMVDKKELMERVWPGVTIGEVTLRFHIAALRKALGDGENDRRFVVTTAGRGYSFVAPISRALAQPASGAGAAPVADNRPNVPTWIVGRDEAIASLASQAQQYRLTTIVRPGGIGKTTVALAVAGALRGRYADGIRFVDLATIADPALAPSPVASALGLPVRTGNPIPPLVAALKGQHVLLVLDNCEHVVDAAAALAEGVFDGAAKVHILATSREALRATGERVHRLPPLEAPPASPNITASDAMAFPAVRLFVERVSATSDAFELSDRDAFAACEICRRLDGIALAIQLAAGRVDTFGVQGVAARLDDRFALLTRGLRTAVPHHQTLSAAFDWSYEFLEPAAQAVLRRLSVLAGSFTLDSAVAIATGDEITRVDVVEQLANLVSTSLVSITSESLGYRLLDSARAYARGKFVESEKYDCVARRHAEYFRGMFQRAEADAAKWPVPMWLDTYGRELDNLRAALDWAFSRGGDVDIGVDLTIAAATLWSRMSLNEECRSRIEVALARLEPATARGSRRGMQLYNALGTALLYTRGSGPEATKAWTCGATIKMRTARQSG